MSSKLLRTRSPPGPLALSLIGLKFSSAIRCNRRRPGFVPLTGSIHFRGHSGLNLSAVRAYSRDGPNSSPETNRQLEAMRQIEVHPATHHIPYRVQSRLRTLAMLRRCWVGSF
jgi:hypothetical protein